jgi:hypothetical protein
MISLLCLKSLEKTREKLRSHRPKYGGASNAFRVYTLLCLRRETGNASQRVATLWTPAGAVSRNIDQSKLTKKAVVKTSFFRITQM